MNDRSAPAGRQRRRQSETDLPDIERLDALEAAAGALHPGPGERADMLAAVAAQAEAFLDRLDSMPAYVSPERGELAALDEPFGEEPGELADALELYAGAVQEPGLHEVVGRFFGFIPGSGVYPAALGDYLAAVTNPYAGVSFAAPGAVRMERALLRWIADFVGYPDTAAGDLTSGGSVAILSAIVTAREAHSVRARDVEKTVVYLTDQTHHCVTKALRIAGLDECVQRRLPLTARYRMDVDALAARVESDRRQGLRPWLIVASAGTTDTGAVDPLEAIAEVAAENGLWLHVDGAYGGAFALTEEGREILGGIEKADSVALDPHKGLFLPFGTGVLLVRDGEKLRDAYAYGASYMQDAGAIGDMRDLSPASASPELTRHFRALRLWLPLKTAGIAAFRAALTEKLLLARYFHVRLGEMEDFEVGPPPDLSIVPFRYLPRNGPADELNRRLVEAIRDDGRIFLSSTQLDGAYTPRMAILNVRTHRRDVDLAIDVIGELTAGLE